MRRGSLAAAVAVLLLLVLAGPAVAFSDVGSSHPYSAAIDDLSSRGVINGFPDGTFGPDQAVTRQQFAKMIVLTLDVPVSEADVCRFTDVETGGYADPLFPDNYIAACATYEITKGTSAATFSPGVQITRAQVVTMVVRAVQRMHQGMLGWISVPSAWGYFDPVHGETAAAASANGFFEGLPVASLDPWGAMPRGEVAQVLHNALDRIEHPPAPYSGVVTAIVDGDTISVEMDGTNESVRLIGIDAPESGEPFSAEAKAALSDLLGGVGMNVGLDLDVEHRDQYGRLLAYVFSGNYMVNAEMLRLGMATLYTVPPNVKYADELAAAQDEARAAGRGIW